MQLRIFEFHDRRCSGSHTLPKGDSEIFVNYFLNFCLKWLKFDTDVRENLFSNCEFCENLCSKGHP